MTVFLTKLAQSIITQLGTLFVRYVRDHYTAWNERRQRLKAQEQKDEATKKPYDQAVQNGTKEEVRRATQDRLNS